MKPSVGTLLRKISDEALNEGDTALAIAVLAASYELGAPVKLGVTPWPKQPAELRSKVINLFRSQCIKHSKQQAEHNYRHAITVLQGA